MTKEEAMANFNGLFNPENRFWSFMEKIMNLCVLGLVWFLFSIPVVTAGAATAALFSYTMKLSADEEGYVWRSFVRGFKENFRQATVLWLGTLALGGLLALDFYVCRYIALPRPVRMVLFFALISIGIVYILTNLYLLPLTAFYRLPLKKIVPHAFIMSMGNLFVSVTILVIYVIAAFFTTVVPALFMIWFAIGSYFASIFFRHVFEKYIPEEAETCED